MNMIRKAVTTLGGIFLAALLIAALAPKVAKAVAAALVRDVDQPARHPFVTQCDVLGEPSGTARCTTPAIPAGEEVVIETVNFSGLGDPGNFVLVPSVENTEGGITLVFNFNPMSDSGLDQPSNSQFQETQSVRLYADPGTDIRCQGLTPGANPGGLFFHCRFSGYTVSLP